MKTWKNAVCSLLILTLALAALSCSTVAPKPTTQKQASFDPMADPKGNVKNSGLLLFTNDCAVISTTAALRYNIFCYRFGNRFTPPTLAGDGLKPFATNSEGQVSYIMDKFHFSQFATMTTWENLPAIKKNQ